MTHWHVYETPVSLSGTDKRFVRCAVLAADRSAALGLLKRSDKLWSNPDVRYVATWADNRTGRAPKDGLVHWMVDDRGAAIDGGPDVAGLPAPISDAAEARITRQMQGLARMIDDLIRENAELRREVATLKTQMLTQADLARFATGMKASMEAA